MTAPIPGTGAMNSDRAVHIWGTIVSRARRDASPVSPLLACLACVEALAVTGAGLVLATSMELLEPVCTTDSRAGRVEELQATVGEGPGIDALETGRPILVHDLSSAGSARQWPMFTPEARQLGLYAMYSLPLAMGAIRVGALNLYHDEPRELSRDELVDALMYADSALLLVLDDRGGIATPLNGGMWDGHGPTLWHAEVHQAAGMTSVQLGVSVLDALVRLRAHAFGHGQTLAEVARAVVERRLRLAPEQNRTGSTRESATNHDIEGQP